MSSSSVTSMTAKTSDTWSQINQSVLINTTMCRSSSLRQTAVCRSTSRRTIRGVTKKQLDLHAPDGPILRDYALRLAKQAVLDGQWKPRPITQVT